MRTEVSVCLVEKLIKHITDRLITHSFCTVFESLLKLSFPIDTKAQKRRNEAIQAFAKENGWKVTINDPGIRVTFKRL